MTDGDAAQVAAQVERRRLAWRCRRGMRELDVLLERFLREDYGDAPESERRAFVALLELPDPVIVDFLLGGVTPADPPLAAVAARVARRGADANC